MIFRRGIDITRGIGWPVLGPGIARVYLGPLNATRRQPSGNFAPKYAKQNSICFTQASDPQQPDDEVRGPPSSGRIPQESCPGKALLPSNASPSLTALGLPVRYSTSAVGSPRATGLNTGPRVDPLLHSHLQQLTEVRQAPSPTVAFRFTFSHIEAFIKGIQITCHFGNWPGCKFEIIMFFRKLVT